jgi:hypothetical protein
MGRFALMSGAALAVVALVSGCSGGGSVVAGADPLAVARKATDVTLQAGSAKFVADARLSTTTLGAMNAHMTGSYDFGRQVGEAELSGEGMTSRSILARNVIYEQGLGGRWRKTDYSSQVNTPVGQQDPGQQLELLRGVSDDVRVVGREQLRGDSVQHFAITIDPKRLAANVNVVVPGSLTEKAIKASEPMPADVYVDEQGRVRKLTVKIALLAANLDIGDIVGNVPEDLKRRLQDQIKNQRGDGEFTIEYFDFGTPVSAQVPDPSLVDEGPRFPR